MSDFTDSLAKTVQSLGLAGKRIVIGVSGGADSVALLRALTELAPTLRMELHAAHLNHQLRGAAADDDAAWTRELCDRLGIPIVVESADVSGRAQANGLTIEEAARIVRYEFLEHTARTLNCSCVAVAHTADDQAETVLHHVLRGTGLAGLCGMRPQRSLAEGIRLVRPLLRTSRLKIERWLAEIGQDFRTDATNVDQNRTRNWIRQSLLPLLEREAGPAVRDSLRRLAYQAEEWQNVIDEAANQLLDACLVDDSPEVTRLDGALLVDRPPHLVREAFVALWKRKNWPRQRMGFEEWDRLYRLLREGKTVNLPGNIEATRRGTLLVLCRR